MKVIISNYTFDKTRPNNPLRIWDLNGICYEGPSCAGCSLDVRDCRITINAFILHLITNNKIVIPCTIAINDYPELFI